MFRAAIVSTAVVAFSGLATAQQGSAFVKNSCSYPVYVTNVPAEGGGFVQITQTLQPGDQYSQQWTELGNGDGWSIKLSKSLELENIMQYEYTYIPTDPIWYDLSDVNGNPWNGNWEITSNNAQCNPKQQAYQYATDDAYGMQACPNESDITVTLCSGDSDDSGSGSSMSAAPSSAAPVSSAAPSSSEAEPTSTFTTPSSAAPTWWGPKSFDAVNKAESPATSASPTTFLTTTSAPGLGGVTVTEVATQVVTQIVTATAGAKRHEHHLRHAHRRQN